MSYSLKADTPRSINDAIRDWNDNHAGIEGITPSTGKINELGKTIFLCHEAQKGYWLEEVNFFEKGLRWLNPEWYAKTILNEEQKTQIAELKKNYSFASQSLIEKSPEIAREINIAKMKVLLGEKRASAYAILMYGNPDQQKIQELIPQLEEILEFIKMLELKPQLFSRSELPDNFNLFKAKSEGNIIAYFEALIKNYKTCLLEVFNEKDSQSEKMEINNYFKEAIATENVFRLYFHKVLDSAPVELRLRPLEGCSSRSLGIGSILEDLHAFLRLNQDSLMPNEIEHLNQAMTNLQLALEIISPIENTKDQQKEIEIKKAAERIHGKLASYSERKEIASESMVVPGGFKKHAILYQIKKNDLGTYDLSIINTGAGAIKVNKNPEKDCSLKSRDVVYTGLRLDELSESFFIELFHITETANDMEEVYDFLDNSLLNHSAQLDPEKGMERSLQKKGTCTIKCILEWLKTELGKELFRDFSSFMRKRAIHSVKKEAKTISPIALKLLFPQMPEEITSNEHLSEQLDRLIDAGKQQLKRKERKKKIVI